MQRKYFSASFPYDEAVTGLWVELIVQYLQEFGDFLAEPVRTRAAKDETPEN